MQPVIAHSAPPPPPGLSLLLAVPASCEGDSPLDWLRNSIPGEPSTDYPIMAATQLTDFSCDGLVFGGYYADPSTECQQYSVCLQVGELSIT